MVSLGSRAFRERIAANAVPDTPIVCKRGSRGIKGYVVLKVVAPEPEKITPLPPRNPRNRKIRSEVCGELVLALHQVPPDPKPTMPVTSLPFFTRQSSMSVEYIQRVVASFYRVGVFDLAHSRRSVFLHARCVAMFLASQLTWETPSEIGSYFGRSGQTVLDCTRSIKKAAETNEKLVSNIRKLHWLLIEKSGSELEELFVGAYPLRSSTQAPST